MPALPKKASTPVSTRQAVELNAPKASEGLPSPSRPKLVNRGPAGLLSKVPKRGREEKVEAPTEGEKPLSGPPLWEVSEKDKIRPELEAFIVDIDSLTPDSENARLHPERNMSAIKDSLCLYGQCKPITVQRRSDRKNSDLVIVTGNGTHASAKELGWTKIAAVIMDMTDIEAAGYGLADNRTAELAKWDFEVVARIDKLLLDAGHASVGWTIDELEVLRVADWTPPAADDGAKFGSGSGGEEGKEPEADPLIVSFTPDEYETVGQAIAKVRETANNPELTQAECLVLICNEWSK